MNGRDRPRGSPANAAPPRERRPADDMRNGNAPVAQSGSMSRAEKFEDEKRRVIQSCFGKRDSDGSALESYITHIRITEDGSYPSTPPPPNSPPENKKPRLIIVSVRKSGRVRMHKARENSDGSFSVGKTWMLDDLSRIQTFEHMNPSNPTDQQHKAWASNVGFVVTISKPYYWQAATTKERDFFIGSLVKVFKRYTGGKVPELVNFDPRERDALTGASPQPTQAMRPQGPGPAPPRPEPAGARPRTPPAQDPRSKSPYTNRARSRDGRKEPVRQPSREPFLRSKPSQDDVRRPRPPFPVAPSRPPPSRDGFSSRANEATAPSSQFPSSKPPQAPPSREGFPPKFNEPNAPSSQFPPSQSSRPPPSRDGFLSRPNNDTNPAGSQFPGPFPPSQPPPSRDGLPSKSTNERSAQGDFGLPSALKSGPGQRGRPDPTGLDMAPSQLQSQPSRSQLSENEPPTSRPPPADNLAKRPDVAKPSQASPEPSDAREPLPPPSLDSTSGMQRPPLGMAKSSFGQRSAQSDMDTFVTPLASPELKKPEIQTPSRGSNKSSNRDLPSSLQSGPMPVQTSSKEAGESETLNEKAVDTAAPLSRLPSIDSPSIVPEPKEPEPPKAPSPPSPPATETPTSKPTEGAEEHRPGLGPMVKKKGSKDLANTFRKAATAYGAFKPRAGGAAERLMAAVKEKKADEPDGITGVVPAPLSRGISAESVKPPTPDIPKAEPTMATPVPKVEITATTAQPGGEKPEEAPVEPTRPKSPVNQAERRRQRREDNRAKYFNALGIDSTLLNDRGVSFDDTLTDIGWDGKLAGDKRIEDLEADVRREIGRVQASSWLGHLELQEGKVGQLSRLFDKTIAECDELDGLLTLYSHELNTLADDVAYIEAQSQGLQVQTANQKLLQNELQGILKTISISSSDLHSLREASLSNPDGIKETETALSVLYKAMVAIDPDVKHNKKRLGDDSADITAYGDSEIGHMRAVKEKNTEYRKETELFLQRLKQYMSLAFKIAEQKLADSLDKSRTGTTPSGLTKIDSDVYEFARKELWMYNALMLFTREVNLNEWSAIMTLYEQQFKTPYQNKFRDNAMAWKREARKPTGDEQDLLFTSQEKDREGESITTAARKLTVRKGKTIRVPGGLRLGAGDKAESKIEPYEAFTGCLDETTRLMSEEQNFVVRFFHVNSVATTDFADLVAASAPEDRKLPNVYGLDSFNPDREMAKKVEQVMDDIFHSWPADTQNMAEWTIKSDPLQGVGVLFALEKKLSQFEETNQEFIVRGLQKIHSRFIGLFNRFVEEQIRGIEETKVKIKKRKGIVSFMKTFPLFSTAVETMITTQSDETFDIRFSINDAYAKINRAMWESLKFIAKEAPGQQGGAAGAGGDPEDKEALNYHIMLIENMNHYVEDVDNRGNIVLMEWQDRAKHDMNEHLRLYIDAVIRRPLGKLLDFIEGTEAMLQTASAPTDIASRASHSRPSVKKLLASYDPKELRRGIDALKKRVDKHFGDTDDPGLSKSLVVKVLKECESRYSDAHDRMRRIIDMVYEGQMELEWRKEEAATMFKRL
ncbi:hypothetical protein AJ80_03771 [Polytolypa hystricis UAMH7299]|uniref:Exocyst complex component Sec3 PIP2-binding N-terminal domain-containing protein n=1 Tax=Polytolypa hystricis (strain UAMH7299) TaxID=1447883 RepID=A0A2B7Y6W7_POLH7|nr:hypothetical protein AJ80_03771 [Polytolypa hystricis UAMH7299]